MPELPEVELCRRDLERWTRGQTIARVAVADPTSVRSHLSTRPADAVDDGESQLVRAVHQHRCTSVRRHGKRLAWDFDSGFTVLVHLGMSGKWVRRGGQPVRHERIRLSFDAGDDLCFVDPRRFGCVVVALRESASAALRLGLGPDALNEPQSAKALAAACQSRGAIKTILLDQSRLAGVGNIQACEALWRAGVRPGRPANSLTSAEWGALSAAIVEQLEWTLQTEAEGEIVYVSEWGSRNPFAVYGREGEPCPRCADVIVRAVHSGRSSFWCPQCQG